MGKWIKCKKCGHEYFSTLSRCPNCSSITVNFKLVASSISFIAVLTVAGIGIALGLGDKSDDEVKVTVQNSSVAEEGNEEKENNNSSKNESAVSSVKEEGQAGENSTFADSVSSEKENSEVENTFVAKTGTQHIGNDCYITVPYFYLRSVYDLFGLEESGMEFEEFAYGLTEDDKAAGFTQAKKNSDGSATKIIPYSKYGSLLADYTSELLIFSFEIKKLDFVEELQNSNTFDSFDIKLTKSKDELSDSEYAQIIVLGVTALEKQYYDKDSDNSCVINIKFSDGGSEALHFPELLKN